jgi:hypothetical protein
MKACDDCRCDKKKICKVYEMIQKFKGEIDIEVNNCAYNGLMFQSIKPVATTPRPVSTIKSSEEVNSKSSRIHALQQQQENSAPETTKKARSLGMQFVVDDEEQT